MSLDEMPAGRELDELIATEIFGWYASRLWRGCFWDPNNHDSIHYSCDEPDEVPRYSTNIAAAWTVVEVLRQRGFGVHLYSLSPPTERPQWHCGFGIRGNGILVDAAWNYSDTAPLAICRAALTASQAIKEAK